MKLRRLSASWVFVLSLLTGVPGFGALDDKSWDLPVGANEFKIMTWNVENLFDTEKDKGKNDATYLPKDHPQKKAGCLKESNQFYREQCFNTDWTPQALSLKLAQIRRAIAAQGVLPDILSVQEVENANVIRQLAKELGYRHYRVSDGPDLRGIDVAILWNEDRLVYESHSEVDVNRTSGMRTRPVLKTVFRLKGSPSAEVLAVYANHWPSQGSPTWQREAAARAVLEDITAGVRDYGRDRYHAVVVGDFNTTANDRPHPIEDVLLPGANLLDSQNLAQRGGNPMMGRMPPATYWYGQDRVWNRFDRILLSENFDDGQGIEVRPESLRILAPEFMTKKDSGQEHRIPVRYDFQSLDPKRAGYSDHLPLVVKFQM